jgi:hypothetical protein
MQNERAPPATSEWLKVMLEEIERKEHEARQGREEEARRQHDTGGTDSAGPGGADGRRPE